MTDEHTESRAEACPFCASLVICRSGFALSCFHCGATGPDADENTFDLALEQWNRRDDYRARIASLTAERDELKLSMEALADHTRDSSEQLRQERDEARARVAALDLNAKRYGWLRSLTVGYRDEHGACRFRLPNIEAVGNVMRGSVAQHLDAAIDAEAATQPAPLKLEPKP